ncbi:MAG: Gfo/Idh/MocA family oxidoreductase [Clostridiales bacterium]|nr:Gfo/Idh/MocA family oxidoreductase [Clostridiales bacterium]
MTPKVGIIGINGFGATHVGVILDLVKKGDLECTAFADVKVDPESEGYKRLIKVGAKHYIDYIEMLEDNKDLDFVVISTPIPLHAPMAVEALERGFNVLLEKPPAVTVQDIDKIIEASERTGNICTVNFQNTSFKSFLELNRMVADGELGEIKSVIGVGLWKRTDAYYERTPWAGELIHNGEYVLDGTVNNPLAHLLNNCLIVAGKGNAEDALPVKVQGELYKGHNIGGEDTACLRVHTQNNIKVLFYTTLCSLVQEIPYIIVKGDKGKATWTYNNDLVLEYNDGEKRELTYDKELPIENIYYNLIDVLNSNEKRLLASIKACKSFVLASNGAFESSKETMKIGDEYLVRKKEGDTISTYIKDIEDIVATALKEEKLFSELGIEWAKKTEVFDLGGYTEFNLFK